MSGIAPYTYLALGGFLTELGFNALQYLYDSDDQIIVTLTATDLFQPGCVTARLAEQPPAHPIGSYNIAYPYCRVALQYDMSDLRSDPQLGQLVLRAPYLAIQLILVGCDPSVPVSVVTDVQPPQSDGCAATLYPGYRPSDLYLVVNGAVATLPLRINFTVNNGNHSKKFWIGVRDSASGLPSGAVIPAKPANATPIARPPMKPSDRS